MPDCAIFKGMLSEDDQALAEAETQDVLDVCETTLGMEF